MRSPDFKGNLVVTNLPEDLTATALADLFDPYGLVLGVQIKEIPSNAGTALLGLVSLAPDKAVDEAVAALNGTLIGRRKLRVGRAKPRPPGAKAGAKPAAPRAVAPKPEAVAAPIPSPVAFPASAAKPVRQVVVEYRTRSSVLTRRKPIV
jgi:RNA recognition motif-containing protein